MSNLKGYREVKRVTHDQGRYTYYVLSTKGFSNFKHRSDFVSMVCHITQITPVISSMLFSENGVNKHEHVEWFQADQQASVIATSHCCVCYNQVTGMYKSFSSLRNIIDCTFLQVACKMLKVIKRMRTTYHSKFALSLTQSVGRVWISIDCISII